MSEYLNRAITLAQDAAKLSLRLSEGLVDNALEFGLDTPGSFYDTAEYKMGPALQKELSSDKDKDKLMAMKRLLATVAKGQDASGHFADVVKNVASGSLEVRRLVYIYLLRYAEQEQDLALLSVNTFQRDLADDNQVIRALALRVMSSIRVQVIVPIVVLAVKKLSGDPSPHVRKAAALAIPKLLMLDGELREELTETVGGMLGESSPLALGSVIRAYQVVCPGRWEMVHKEYRRWCGLLQELDEWGQMEMVRLLATYGRTQFMEPLGDMEADHRLLLDSIEPLLRSHNSAVVMSAVSAFYHIAPTERLGVVSKPLIRLLKQGRETQYVVLTNVLQISRRRPELFREYVESFYVAGTDPEFARQLKLQIMSVIMDAKTMARAGAELEAYGKRGWVGAAQVWADSGHRAGSPMQCLQRLLQMIVQDNGRHRAVSNAAMRGVRQLLLDGSVRDDASKAITLYDILSYLVLKIKPLCQGDEGRAHVIGLVGEFINSRFGQLHGADVLRQAARDFKQSGELTKIQVLELSRRLGQMAEPEERHEDLHRYVFLQARYDVSFGVRERARMLKGLEESGLDRRVARDLLMVASNSTKGKQSQKGFVVGSLALTMGHPTDGYAGLPEWPSTRPEAVDRGQIARAVKAETSSRAINIAGISGRAVPHTTDGYGTPRNTAAMEEDLDAFLDSEDSGAVRRPFAVPVATEPTESSSESEEASEEPEPEEGKEPDSSSSGLESDSSEEQPFIIEDTSKYWQ